MTNLKSFYYSIPLHIAKHWSTRYFGHATGITYHSRRDRSPVLFRRSVPQSSGRVFKILRENTRLSLLWGSFFPLSRHDSHALGTKYLKRPPSTGFLPAWHWRCNKALITGETDREAWLMRKVAVKLMIYIHPLCSPKLEVATRRYETRLPYHEGAPITLNS